MKEATLKRGDACPRDGGSFKPARVPTDAEWAKSKDREDPTVLPEGCDTAPADFRAEHGALNVCMTCGYQTRFLDDKPAESGAAGA